MVLVMNATDLTISGLYQDHDHTSACSISLYHTHGLSALYVPPERIQST